MSYHLSSNYIEISNPRQFPISVLLLSRTPLPHALYVRTSLPSRQGRWLRSCCSSKGHCFGIFACPLLFLSPTTRVSPHLMTASQPPLLPGPASSSPLLRCLLQLGSPAATSLAPPARLLLDDVSPPAVHLPVACASTISALAPQAF
jgi:hypothetical protein